jgi:hypothetical protein
MNRIRSVGRQYNICMVQSAYHCVPNQLKLPNIRVNTHNGPVKHRFKSLERSVYQYWELDHSHDAKIAFGQRVFWRFFEPHSPRPHEMPIGGHGHSRPSRFGLQISSFKVPLTVFDCG